MNLDFLKNKKVMKDGAERTIVDVDNEKGRIILNPNVEFQIVSNDGVAINEMIRFNDEDLPKILDIVEEIKIANVKRVLQAGTYYMQGHVINGPVMKLTLGDAFSTETDILNRCFQKGYTGYQQGGCQINDIYHAWFPKIAEIIGGTPRLQNENDKWINYFDSTGDFLFETNVKPEVAKEKKAYEGLDRITFAKYKDGPYVFVGVYRNVMDPDNSIRKYHRIATTFDLSDLNKRI